MKEQSLAPGVIKKIQMTKILFDLAADCFKIPENLEKIGSGIILIQDAIELFLLALCEHSDAKIKNDTSISGLIQALEVETKQAIILKRQILNINKQRVNIKHFGFSPNISDCRDFLTDARTFFQENAEIILKSHFDSITLIDLIKDNVVKRLLQEAWECLEKGQYKECQISCRKALYCKFESRFNLKGFENKESGKTSLLDGVFTEAPLYSQNKDYIEKNVKEPVDYICIDFDRLDKELLTVGISPVDYWNIWRLTPKVYFDDIEKEWVIQEDYNLNSYNEQNAEYCFRKTVEIILLKEKEGERQRLGEGKGGFVYMRLKDDKAMVFKKASSKSEVIYNFEDFADELYIISKTRGLDEKKHYYFVCSDFIGKKSPFVVGYIREEDVAVVDRHELGITKDKRRNFKTRS